MAQVDEVGDTLLRAASELLANDGPSALTVRRIANRAGVSTMNVYSRFGSKDGVIDRLYMDGFSRLREAMDRTRDDDPIADVHQCMRSYRRFAKEHPTYYAVMFSRVIPDHVPSVAAAEHATETLALLGERMVRAIASGALASLDPLHAAAVMWATGHGVVSLEMERVGPPGIDWTIVYETACSAVLAGLATPTARTR